MNKLLVIFVLLAVASSQSFVVKVASPKKLGRAQQSIAKKETKELQRIHKFHEKINHNVEKTNELMNTAIQKSQARGKDLSSRLARYVTRKLRSIDELYKMAPAELQPQMTTLFNELKQRLQQKEVEIRRGFNMLLSQFRAILKRTAIQVQQAKEIGDKNDEASKLGITAIGENIVKGIKMSEATNTMSTKQLRTLKKTTKDAEKKIAHEFHAAEKIEKSALKDARHELRLIRNKLKSTAKELRHTAKADIRKLFNEANRKFIKMLVNHQTTIGADISE